MKCNKPWWTVETVVKYGNRGTRDEVQQTVVDCGNRSELSYSNKLRCKLSTNLAAKKRIFAKEQV